MSVFSLAPYHLITYATLTGTTFFHSFVNGIVMFRVLERPQFSAVQAKLFPIYFSMQAALPVVLAVTYPGGGSALSSSSSSVAGVFEGENLMSVLLPLGTILVTGLVNLTVLLPMANQTTKERRDQGESYTRLERERKR